MPLELRKETNGTIRPIWYGRYKINGKRFCQNLGVKITGTPPASLSLKDEGDAAFERSRATALAKLESIVEEARTKRDSARLVEKLYEIKTGERIKSVKLAELAEHWLKIPRRHKPDARYASQCQSALKRFAEFVQAENPKADELAHVTRTTARSFLDAEANRGVASKTWNDTLKLLRATFKYLLPAGAINPFSDTPTKDTETVFRKPFSPEELKAIMEAAQGDDFIRPIIVTGICTAMRRGDCCLLRWKDVDLERRFITVKTAKTGQTVSIPIFPMLYDELAALANEVDTSPSVPLPDRGGEGSGYPALPALQGRNGKGNAGSEPGAPGKGYVFPEQAQMYLENPDGITWRVKKVLAVALGEGEGAEGEPALPTVSRAELQRRGLAWIEGLPASPKKEHLRAVFERYAAGTKLCDAASEAGVSKGSASNYLNEIEDAIGCLVVRGRKNGRSMTAMLKGDSDLLRAKRDGGTRRASVRDFHSFRVTWVTLALTAGVPLELVQKVTGHKTTDIVLKHYFQPGREAFRQALHSAMPKLLTNGQKSPKEELREIIERVTPKTWKADKARLLELVGKL